MNKKRAVLKSVFFRYSLSLVVVILLSFVVLIAVVNFVIGAYYVDIRQKELARLASSGAELIKIDYKLYIEKNGTSEGLIDIDNIDLRERISALSNGTDMFIFVTDREGNIESFDNSASELRDVLVDPAISGSLSQNRDVEGISDCGVFYEEHYYYGMEVRNRQNQYIATVYACIPATLVKAPVSVIMRIFIVVCLGVLLAAVILSYFVSGRITHPLAEMSRAAKAFAAGDFTVRVPVRGGSEIAEFASVFNDMAESLENMDQTRNDFIANVSHDLRSPMTSISGFVDGMLTGVIPPEKHDHYLRIVLNETKRLSRLVAALLDISRIQAGERKFHMTSFDICEMARQIIISFENRIEEKNLDVMFDAEEDRIYVTADLEAIYQVLYNLCDNATKFAADGKRFTVSIREKKGKVFVRVFNEGEGIADEDKKHIFERFYKGDKSRGLDKSGTGLGMYIVKTILDAHGETIELESRQGEYCAFTFTLTKDNSSGKKNDKRMGD